MYQVSDGHVKLCQYCDTELEKKSSQAIVRIILRNSPTRKASDVSLSLRPT